MKASPYKKNIHICKYISVQIRRGKNSTEQEDRDAKLKSKILMRASPIQSLVISFSCKSFHRNCIPGSDPAGLEAQGK